MCLHHNLSQASMSMEDEEDVHLLAECLCRDGQYQRAMFRLKSKGLLKPTNTRFRALAAKCLVGNLYR